METYKNEYNGKNVLITGGLGFIGSNLAQALVTLKANVLIVDSLIPDYGGNLYNLKGIENKVKVNFADIRSEPSMNILVQNQDYIFNLAGQVSHIDSMNDPYTDLEINCRSQLTILESCRKFNPEAKILFAGTRGQYGRADYLPVDEKHLMHPTDVNGINKMAGEWYHIMYNNVYGIRACSLRLTNTYGPRHTMKSSRQGFLSWFIRLAIDGETIKIFGDGRQLRDFNYVDDVVEAMLMTMATDKSNGEVFNLGSGKPIGVIEVTKMLLSITKTGRLETVPFPPEKKKIEIGDYYADFSKIKKVIGWEPKTSLEEGLRRTVDFYGKNRSHYWGSRNVAPG